MKSLKLYLTESEQTYNFRLKLANEFDDETMNKIETLLDKYELKRYQNQRKRLYKNIQWIFKH